MIRLRRLFRDASGASAAEYALVLPLLLIVLFGTIDVGRYAWSLNQAQKATQIGARWAVATNAVATSLQPIAPYGSGYDFAVTGGIPQGTIVPKTVFNGSIECISDGTNASCTCTPGSTCNFPTTADTLAFNRLVTRMAQISPDITASKVKVAYSRSELGFSGDPIGPQISPLTTVSLQSLKFVPFTSQIFGGRVDLPQFAYTLPMEDGSGTSSN